MKPIYSKKMGKLYVGILLGFLISCSSNSDKGASPSSGGPSDPSTSPSSASAPVFENKLLYEDEDNDGIGTGPGIAFTIKNSVIPKGFTSFKFQGKDDNCPEVFNPDQSDTLKSGLGDACDPTFKSNPVDGDQCGFGSTYTSFTADATQTDPEIGTAANQALKILKDPIREIDSTTLARDPGLKSSIKYLLKPNDGSYQDIQLVQVLKNGSEIPFCAMNEPVHSVLKSNQCLPQRSSKIELWAGPASLKMNPSDFTATSSIYFDATQGIFLWAPSASQHGLYTFYFTATDANQNQTHQTLKVCVKKPAPCSGTSAFCKFLSKLPSNGPSKTAGNFGDWYQNCDNFHSNLPNWQTDHTQVDRVKTFCWGSSATFLPEKVIIGNSSTSGSTVCSSARCTSGLNHSGKYTTNSHFWFPEHRDHDANDYFHSNFMYASASQGSSSSEMDEMDRFFKILASFKDSTKQELIKQKLLIPTVMMIDRCTRFNTAATCKSNNANSAHPYLQGIAHPSVFDDLNTTLIHYARSYYEEEFKYFTDDEINNAILRKTGSPKTLQDRMSVLLNEVSLEAYKLAYSLEPTDIAPLVELEILYETPFPEGLASIRGTTLYSINRQSKDDNTNPFEMVIRAKARAKPGANIQFFWQKLRLNPAFQEALIISDPNCTGTNYCTPSADCKVENGCYSSTKRIQFKTPRAFSITRAISAGTINSPVTTKRHDIGVFIHNGSTFSAPSFITHSGTW